ncbi:GIY-YIG nuclease family protein [Rothia amarae]|uniref:GIY-YIG nuclease family protein n=1 Tax=Rothia amarae TaxID=169480 RepID=A0A7H2BIX7_9MICC|nr:GIY-YIG nuclease family protein [Rothia amarae]QNV39623.1 GIY-YIG nuclease family protein [Rothia amarae]
MTEKLSYEEELDLLILEDEDGLLNLPEKPKPITSTDRLERAFLEIVEFRREHGCLPSSETLNISERKLGARLEGFLSQDHKAEAVRHLDEEFGLLTLPDAPESLDDLLASDDFDLLDTDNDIFDISTLPDTEYKEDDFEVAQRKKAKDFAVFEPLFKTKHKELEDGSMKLVPFSGVSTIREGRFFVLGGLMAFVAEVGKTEYIEGTRRVPKERLRVIFENGTESSMYRQSLAGRLGEHNGFTVARSETSITEIEDADIESGHIYVLKSLSANPDIASLQHLHKIGFSTKPVIERISRADTDPTYLMAPVEVQADYRVYNVKASRLEHLIHKLFTEVRLDISQVDSNGKQYDPSEWFIVPLEVIDQAIEMIISEDIVDFIYSPSQEKLIWSRPSSKRPNTQKVI